jgi:C1A family cysteine protease
MKTASILTLAVVSIFTVFLFTSSPTSDVEGQFQDFLSTYRVGYSSTNEYSYRLSVFKQNLETIARLNRESDSAVFAVNKFADKTAEEMKAMMGFRDGFKSCPSTQTKTYTPKTISFQNLYTEVKDQGQCGSCWAFSATAAFEGRYALKNGQKAVSEEFSEQQLVDCDTNSNGCNGGLMDLAYGYLSQGHSFCHEEEYSYQAKDENCRDSICKTTATLNKDNYCTDLNTEAEDIIGELVNGPIAVAVDATSWQFYSGGIMKSTDCGTSLNHGVTLVAADLDITTPIIIIRNSWGAGWGENGHIKLQYKNDTCGWTQVASIPNIA